MIYRATQSLVAIATPAQIVTVMNYTVLCYTKWTVTLHPMQLYYIVTPLNSSCTKAHVHSYTCGEIGGVHVYIPTTSVLVLTRTTGFEVSFMFAR